MCWKVVGQLFFCWTNGQRCWIKSVYLVGQLDSIGQRFSAVLEIVQRL